MTPDAQAWGWICAILSLPGLCLALIEWPTIAIVVTFLLTTMLAGIATILQRTADAEGKNWLVAEGYEPTMTMAVLVGLTSVSLAATLEVSPALAFLTALAITGSSPWARDRIRRLRPISPAPMPLSDPPTNSSLFEQHPAVVVEDLTVHELSNAELCTAWRSSYTALQRAETPLARARLVANRQRYLDEMELRNPAALTAWLTSGARAASGPDRYLRDGTDPHY